MARCFGGEIVKVARCFGGEIVKVARCFSGEILEVARVLKVARFCVQHEGLLQSQNVLYLEPKSLPKLNYVHRIRVKLGQPKLAARESE